MVEKRNCSFCGEAIEPGTGKMYVKKDGTVFNFCSNKCKKNNIGLGRVPRRTRWTTRYGELKASTLGRKKGEPQAEAKPKKPASKKSDEKPEVKTKKSASKKADEKPEAKPKKAHEKPKKTAAKKKTE